MLDQNVTQTTMLTLPIANDLAHSTDRHGYRAPVASSHCKISDFSRKLHLPATLLTISLNLGALILLVAIRHTTTYIEVLWTTPRNYDLK